MTLHTLKYLNKLIENGDNYPVHNCKPYKFIYKKNKQANLSTNQGTQQSQSNK